MRANTSKFLDNFRLKNILRSYILAYLKTKKIGHDNHFQPTVVNHWHLGALEEGHLIKGANNSLFLGITCPEITDDNEARERQAIGSNIQEKMLDVIAFLILQGHKKLPTDNLNLSFLINHHNLHWTALVVKFQGLDKKAYLELYQAYQAHRLQTGENTGNDLQKPLHVRLSYVKNFIIDQKGLMLNHTDKETKELVHSNWMLPLDAKKIQLNQFDSLGAETAYTALVEKSCQDFLVNHTEAVMSKNCPQLQEGTTCGDWSVYNAFRDSVLRTTLPQPESKKLRLLAHHTSVENAHQILFEKNPKLKEVPKSKKIRVAKYNQALEQILDSGGVSADSSSEECSDAQADGKTKDKLTNSARTLLNNPFPALRFINRLVFIAAMSLLAQVYLIPALTLSTAWAGVGVVAAVAVMSFFTFNLFLKGFFGESLISFKLNEQKEPVVTGRSDSGGLAALFGMKAPYHRTLAEVETEISGLYRVKGDGKKQPKPIIHVYTRNLVNANKQFFYDEDIAKVNEPGYISDELDKPQKPAVH